MPVNHLLKVVFIHIPKTAGTSIEYALGMHDGKNDIGIVKQKGVQKNYETLFGKKLQHLSAFQIQKELGKQIFKSYFKFTIVRNPYERLVSYVAWLNGKWVSNEMLTREEFQDYIMRNFFLGFSRNRLLIPQRDFLCYRHKVLIDMILRYENLENDYNNLKEKIGITTDLEKRMVSQHMEYPYYYGKKEIKVVQKYYANDFNFLGYNSNSLK